MCVSWDRQTDWLTVRCKLLAIFTTITLNTWLNLKSKFWLSEEIFLPWNILQIDESKENTDVHLRSEVTWGNKLKSSKRWTMLRWQLTTDDSWQPCTSNIPPLGSWFVVDRYGDMGGVQIQNYSGVTVGFCTPTVYGTPYFQYLSLVCMLELMCDRFRNPPLYDHLSSEVTITFQKIAFYYFLPWKFQWEHKPIFIRP
jgi:hypothetical protein